MSGPLTEQAPAKINLTLRVLGRRADGYHNLESLVGFADIADILALEAGGGTSLEVSGKFAAACGPLDDNLVLKAAAALKQRVERLVLGRFTLEKRIPVAAGLGGGSADAAAALRLIARANSIAIGDPRLRAAAVAIGADVPVCLESKARVIRGIGEALSAPLALSVLPALLVNPRVAMATGEVFDLLEEAQAGGQPLRDVPQEHDALIGWLASYRNDLTQAAIALHSVVGEVLEALRALPGCRLARMSGAGATCFGLFDSDEKAGSAAQKLRAAGRGWWLHAGSIR